MCVSQIDLAFDHLPEASTPDRRLTVRRKRRAYSVVCHEQIALAPSCAPGWAFLIRNISRCIELNERIDPLPGRDPKRQHRSI
jgi:hypothetical protein